VPLLDALEPCMQAGVYHRDIAPDNILLTPTGAPVLLDFGAARRVIGDRSQNLTAILKPAYAPIEQYAEVERMRQGPWTDLYALGATLHFLLTGAPPRRPRRAVHDACCRWPPRAAGHVGRRLAAGGRLDAQLCARATGRRAWPRCVRCSTAGRRFRHRYRPAARSMKP
jgi:serine/threonine protein kinase